MALFDSEHETIPLGKNHRTHDLEFADAAARNAATYVADDIGKDYRDLDTNTWWKLVSQAAGVGTFREVAVATGAFTGHRQVSIPFAFGDAFPSTIFTTAVTTIIYNVAVVMLNLFNLEPITFNIGTAVTPGELFTVAELGIDADVSEASNPTSYAPATNIQLAVAPAVGTTSGSGIVILSIKE